MYLNETNTENGQEEEAKGKFNAKGIVWPSFGLCLVVFFLVAFVANSSAVALLSFLPIEVRYTYLTGALSIPLSIFVLPVFHHVFIMCSLAYFLRWLHFEVEKSRTNDRNISGGFYTLLTLINLEGKAQKHKGGTNLEIVEEDYQSRGNASDSGSSEEDNDVRSANGELAVVDEYKNPFISQWFCVRYRRFSSVLFTDLVTDEGDSGFFMKKLSKNVVLRVFRSLVVVFLGLLSIFGTISDIAGLVYWFAFGLFTSLKFEKTFTYSIGAAVFTLVMFVINFNGLGISVSATLPFYFIFFRERNKRKGEASLKRDYPKGVNESDYETMQVDMKWKRLAFVQTVIVYPLAIFAKLLDIDVIIHVVRQYSGKLFSRCFIWLTHALRTIGKTSPMAFMQIISVMWSSTLMQFTVVYRSQIAVEHISLFLPIFFSVFSLVTSLITVQNTLFRWNFARYKTRFYSSWKLNYIVLQISSQLSRVSLMISCCFLAMYVVLSYIYETDQSDDFGYSLIVIVLLFICFGHFSIAVRCFLLAIPRVIGALRNVRLFYAPFHAAQAEILIEAFAGCFGMITNMNPSTSFLLTLFVNTLEFSALSTIIGIALFVFTFPGRRSSDLLSSSSGSVAFALTDLPYFRFTFFLTLSSYWISFAIFLVYISTAFVHIIAFPVRRQKPFWFGTEVK